MARFAFGLFLAVLLVSPAAAGVIATPALDPDALAGEKVACIVANVSDSKTVEVTATIYDFNGSTMFGPGDIVLAPLRNTRLLANDTDQGHCVVKVRKGGTRNVRVSLHIRTPAGRTIAAVSGSSR